MTSVAVTDSQFLLHGLIGILSRRQKRSGVAIKPERLLERCSEKGNGGWKGVDFDDRTQRPNVISVLYIFSHYRSYIYVSNLLMADKAITNKGVHTKDKGLP